MNAQSLRLLLVSTTAAASLAARQAPQPTFTQTFPLADCTFVTTGRTTYFVLEPGHTRVLQDKSGTRLVITVLGETENVGGVTTRIVEERETEHGVLVEVSRNYFAMCAQNNSVFYFGESVDNYKNGKVVNHEGAWRHGSNGATAGLMMPALPLVGARFYQEVAPQVAMDRAEIIATTSRLQTPFGAFVNVVEMKESSPLEPGVTEMKAYAPGIGLVRDAELLLVSVTSGTRR